MLQKRRDRPGPDPDFVWFNKFAEDRGIISRNRILSSLSQATLRRILPNLEPMNIVRGQIIDQVDRPIEYIYFVNRGLVSFVKSMQDGRTVEVGAVGIEGITYPNALFGVDKAIVGSMVQIPGTAVRIRRDILQREMEKDSALLDMMHKCAHFAISQLVQTAACECYGTIRAELKRLFGTPKRR
jgi:hypothetical protein